MNDNLISQSLIRKQAVYYYLVLILWPAYLFFLPFVLVNGRWWVILYLVFPGLYLFTWLGYLMHESWHKFVPTVNNRFFYNAFALMILSDPQLYDIIHSTHHGKVHTWEDAEFHPVGEIKSGWLRIVYNWLEVILGIAFLEVVGSISIPGDKRFAGKYRFWKLIVSILSWAAFLGTLAYISHLVFGITLAKVLLSYLLVYWTGSFFLHQSQLIEHGNRIMEGTFRERNLRTRNLQPSGFFEKVFLFLTHDDSREHVLHHTMTYLHSRPFAGFVPLPDGAVMINMADYLKILGRMLAGKTDQDKDHNQP